MLSPDIPTIGLALTVNIDVGSEAQSDPELMKVKVAEPTPKDDTKPDGDTDATVASLLVQNPPVVGVSDDVSPRQSVLSPMIVATGFVYTLMVVDGSEAH